MLICTSHNLLLCIVVLCFIIKLITLLQEKLSLKIKWIMFACIMTATTGLLTAFILHRVYCVPYGKFCIYMHLHSAKISVKRLPTIPTSGLTLNVTKCTYLQFKDLFYNKWMKQLLFQFFGESFFKYLIMLCIIVLRNCSASYRYIFLSFFFSI